MRKTTRTPIILFLTLLASLSFTFAASGQVETSDSATPVVAEIPDIQFIVYRVEDPYSGTITYPAALDPNSRYIGVEVAIVNNGENPVNTIWTSVRLRDSEGRDYAGGSASGTDLPMRTRELASGEVNRGWVWFAVPKDAEITLIYLIPPATEIRVNWDDAPRPPRDSATPAATPMP